MAMSMPTSSPFSFSKCQGALVEPVPTRSLPRLSTVRSWLVCGACAAAWRAPSVAPAATAAPASPRPDSFINSRRCLRNVIIACLLRLDRTLRRPAVERRGGILPRHLAPRMRG
jgi:hypothetical protein